MVDQESMNGMRTASKGFGELVADVRKKFNSSEEKQTHRSTKTPNPKQQSYSTLTTQSWHHHQQTAQVWKRIGEHVLLKAHEVMTPDRPIKYLSRQCVKVHAHGRRGFKVRLPQEYFASIARAMEVGGLRDTNCPTAQEIWTNRGTNGQEVSMLGASDHPRYRAGVGKLQFMINEVPEIAHAVKNLSRQPAKPSVLDMQDLKQ